MRIAYLDCFSGISGDMFSGALLDAGLPARVLQETVNALNIGARLEISRVTRSGVAATKVGVLVGDEREIPREQVSHTQAHQRGLKEIRETIRTANISPAAQARALAIFQALGEAEAKVQNTPVEGIQFHEVGAEDAMVDIACAAAGSLALGVEEWVCSPLNVGGGTVQSAHGNFPVPSPATIELLQGAPAYSSGVDAELVTPIGAAIVKTLCKRFGPFPAMKIEAIGYGAGLRDLPGHANVVRLTVGEYQALAETGIPQEIVAVLETNMDDLNPQVFGYMMNRALAEGALDVFGTPVQMKKNRPGMLLTIVARPEDATRLARLVFGETTTLGIRMRQERMQALARRTVTVRTRWGDVRMKIALLNDSVTNYAPEYEDCRRIADEQKVPLKQVMQEASRRYLEIENQ